MSERVKLSTFINKHLTETERCLPGFTSALLLLPELYSASFSSALYHQLRTKWYGITEGWYEEWVWVNEAFWEATRAEVWISPEIDERYEHLVYAQVYFFKGREQKAHQMQMHFRFNDGTLARWLIAGQRGELV